MHLRLILTIYSILITCFVFSNYTAYYKTLNKARFYTQDKPTKIELFEDAFELNTPFAKDAFTLAQYYLEVNNKKMAEKWLKKSIELGMQFFPDANYFEKFQSPSFPEIDYTTPLDSNDQKSDFIFDYLAKKYVTLRSEFIEKTEKNTDFEQLLFAENYFQESRAYYFDHYKENDTLGYHCAQKYSYLVNSMLCLKLMENNAFPKRRETRRFNSKSISILLNHVIAGFGEHEDKALKTLDFARKMVYEGELTPWEFASAYDHYIVCFKSDKSAYGTRFSLTQNHEPMVNELLYPDKVDSLRQEIGLIPLDDWCRIYNYKLPINYAK